MLYFKTDAKGTAIAAQSEYPGNDAMRVEGLWLSRHDFKTFQVAAQVAEELGVPYIAVDSGPGVSPRYDVIKAPVKGDKVSYAFNGDYYPDGEVVSVSPTLVIKTSAGHTYRRRKLTGSWLQTGGTWALVHGHVNKRNPSF